jgi:hypothetical protein
MTRESRSVLNDLAISLIGYVGVLTAALLEMLLIGRLMCGRGRIVILALAALPAGLIVQALIQWDGIQICVAGKCLRPLVRAVEAVLNNVPWSPDWIGKYTSVTLANVVLLLAGPLLVLTLAQLVGVLSNKPLDDTGDRKDGFRKWLVGRGNKRLYGSLFGSAVLTGGAIIALAALNPRSAMWRDLLDDLSNVVWAAPILSFGLLWTACRSISIEDRATSVAPVHNAEAPPKIADLYDSYLGEYQELLLYHAALRPMAPVIARPPPDTASMIGRVVAAAQALGYNQLEEMRRTLDAAFGRSWKEPEEGRDKSCPIFEESPTFLHFILFAELVLSCQDRGGCTLLVAPETSLKRIEEQLRKALTIHFAGYTQRVWNAETQPQGVYDVLIVSPERMESDLLSRGDASILDALERLDLVMVLDYQNIDASLLRIRLARLRRLTGNRTIDVVCQSEPRAGLRPKLANTISALVPVTPDGIQIGGRGSAERYWLFWRNDTNTLRRLLAVEMNSDDHFGGPIEVVPLTLLRAIDQKYDAIFFDPYGRAHRATWRDVLDTRSVPDRLRPFMDADWTLFPGAVDRVVVIEDMANLIAAARKNMNFMHHADCLTHIVSHNYPMREYLLEVLRREVDGVIARREVGGRISDVYLPIAPHPTGGPIELAIDLATEFIRTGKVKQHDVEARFREVLPGGVSETLEIAPTKRGLQNLFGHQRNFKPEINIIETLGHEHEFEIKDQGRLHLEPNFLLPVKLPTGAAAISYVDQQDEGLTFGRGTLLQIRGFFYEVLHIFDTHVAVGHSQFPRSQRPVYLFARQYVVHFAPRLTFLEDKDVPAAALGRGVYELRLLLRGSYDRTTVAMAPADEISFNLARGDGGWESMHVQKSSSNASIMLVRFALAATHPQVANLDAAAFSRLAFTLAATLQDTLRSFFPALAASLAVMSPQAALSIDAFIEVLNTGTIEPLDQLPFNLYPRLIGEHYGRAAPEGESPSEAERRHFEDVARGAAPERKVRELIDNYIRTVLSDAEQTMLLSGAMANQLFTAEPNRIIDLIIVEDASHDRGAVRALFEDYNWSHVVTAWAGFVQWASGQSGGDNFFYAFGRGRVPNVLALREAAEFLGTVVQNQKDRPAANEGKK